MSRVDVQEENRSQELWDEYVAMQLAPAEKAALRQKVDKNVDVAAREGVYERVIEMVGKVKWNSATAREQPVMAKTEAATSEEDAAWAEYFAMQLTPEEKAAARAELECAAAGAADVYERFLSLVGKVQFDCYDLDELREDRD